MRAKQGNNKGVKNIWTIRWTLVRRRRVNELPVSCEAKGASGARIIRRVERGHQNGRWKRRSSSHRLFSLGYDDCGIDAACKLSRATNFTLTTIDCGRLIRGGFWQLSQSGLEPKSFTLTLWLFAPCRVHIAKLYGVKNPQIMRRAGGRAICFQQAQLHSLPLSEPIGNDQQIDWYGWTAPRLKKTWDVR